jgi:hypothetical protein
MDFNNIFKEGKDNDVSAKQREDAFENEIASFIF